MKRTKNNNLYYFYIITLYIFVFQNYLQNYSVLVQYFDEVFSISIIVVMLLKLYLCRNKKIYILRNTLLIIFLLLIIVVTGIYQNIIYKYQPIKYYLGDVLLCIKFFCAYFLSRALFSNDFFNKNSVYIARHIKGITWVLFILTILNYLFKIFPYEYRYGIMANRIFYNHPSSLAEICIFLFIMYYLNTKKLNDKYNYMLLTIIVSTLRMKAIGFVVISIILFIYNKKCNHKISFTKYTIIGILAFLIGFSQIEYYFTLNGSARLELTRASIKIAKDYFPFGTGFATFGTSFSAKPYSPIYFKYKLNNVFGLTKENPIFICDTFWPVILGQFGIVGLVCYIGAIYLIFQTIQKEYTENSKYTYIAKITALFYLLIASTSETAFLHSMSIPLAVIIGINCGQQYKYKKQKDNE